MALISAKSFENIYFISVDVIGRASETLQLRLGRPV